MGGLQGTILFYCEDYLVRSCSHPSGYLCSHILTDSHGLTLALVQPFGKLIEDAGPGEY